MKKKGLHSFFVLVAMSIFIILSSVSVLAGVADYSNFYGEVAYDKEIVFLEDFLDDQDFRDSIRDMLISVYGLEFMQNQTIAIENFQAMRSTFPENRLGQIMYPSFYGGSYIDSNGNLVTLIVYGNESSVAAQEVLSLAQPLSIESEPNNTRLVQFSFSELTEIMDYIHAFHMNNPYNPVRDNIGSAFLDVIENVVVVELWDLDDMQTALFIETVIDSPAIIFGQYVHVPFEGAYTTTYVDFNPSYNYVSPRNTAVNPGAAIRGGNSTRSLGYRATRNSVAGFVTAAHVGAGSIPNNQRFYVGNTFIGTTTAGSVNRNIVDAAFVTAASGVNVTRQISSIETHGTTIFDPIVGATIVRLSHGGPTSPVFSEGRIVNVDALWTYGGHSIRTVQTSGLQSTGGDSGGLIFHENLSNLRDHRVAGIHVANNLHIRARRIGTYLGAWPS